MDPVPPGASRTYAFTLPPGCAGTYWYHPHTHETTHEQVFRGLAGCLIVRPAIEPLAGIAERVMMVTDLRLDANNQIAANTIQDSTFGREGDHLLINGAKLPTLSVQPGATERWRIINATNARYLRLALTGHTLRIAGTARSSAGITTATAAPAVEVRNVSRLVSAENDIIMPRW